MTAVIFLIVGFMLVGIGFVLGSRWMARHAGRAAVDTLGEVFDGIQNALDEQGRREIAAENAVRHVDLGNTLAIDEPSEDPDAEHIGPFISVPPEMRAKPRLVR